MLGLLGGCLLGAVVGGIGIFGGFHASTAPDSPTVAARDVLPTTADASPSRGVQAQTPAAPTATAMPAHPVSLLIPSIKVQTSMELLGLASDGTLQTPTDPKKAGWFTGSSLPGQPGPVVIAGHVDSTTGPAVFIHLKALKPGDAITITLSDGSHVGYRVTSIVTYAKDHFPTQSVYGPRPDSELRLITCGGAFVNGHYVDNVIVFAALSS